MVKFTFPEAGWINCQVSPLHDKPEIFCSHIYDPFTGFLAWLELIAAGSEAATLRVNEEGSISRLQYYCQLGDFEGDDAHFLLHIQTEDTVGDVKGVRVERRQLVEAFYQAFRAMASDPAYVRREWEIHPDVTDWEALDEDAYDEARGAFPFEGGPLQPLRSDAIEQYLGRAPR